MRVLGIDPGLMCGVAHGVVGGAPIASLIRIPDGTSGLRKNIMRMKILELIQANSITHVFCEEPFIGKERNPTIARSLWGWIAAIDQACDSAGIAMPKLIQNTQWRKFIMNRSPPKGCKDKTAWWKEQAVNYCQQRGWEIPNHNVADAACIWVYGTGQADKTTLHESTPLFANVRL